MVELAWNDPAENFLFKFIEIKNKLPAVQQSCIVEILTIIERTPQMLSRTSEIF
jgi:hypothetical protein